jgi:hypothetical protein
MATELRFLGVQRAMIGERKMGGQGRTVHGAHRAISISTSNSMILVEPGAALQRNTQAS